MLASLLVLLASLASGNSETATVTGTVTATATNTRTATATLTNTTTATDTRTATATRTATVTATETPTSTTSSTSTGTSTSTSSSTSSRTHTQTLTHTFSRTRTFTTTSTDTRTGTSSATRTATRTTTFTWTVTSTPVATVTRTPTPNGGAPCGDTEQQLLCQIRNLEQTIVAGGLTVSILDPVVTSTQTTGQANCNTTADLIFTFDSAIEDGLITHTGLDASGTPTSNGIFLGSNASVTTSTGTFVAAGSTIPLGRSSANQWYGVTLAGAVKVTFLRIPR